MRLFPLLCGLVACHVQGCVLVDSPLSIQFSVHPPTLTITRFARPEQVGVPVPVPVPEGPPGPKEP